MFTSIIKHILLFKVKLFHLLVVSYCLQHLKCPQEMVITKLITYQRTKTCVGFLLMAFVPINNLSSFLLTQNFIISVMTFKMSLFNHHHYDQRCILWVLSIQSIVQYLLSSYKMCPFFTWFQLSKFRIRVKRNKTLLKIRSTS